jgi:hypothetical protein
LEIKDLRTSTLLEGAAERSVHNAVLAAWTELQELRERQGFVACPTRLVTSQSTVSEGRRKQEERHFKDSLKQLVRELKRERRVTFSFLPQSQNNDTVSHQKSTGGDDEEADSQSDLVDKASKLLSESIKPPGDPDLTLDVVHDLETSRDSKSLKYKIRKYAIIQES